MFSDFKYILSLDKDYPMSHKYFIRKIKACELVLQIRCHGFRKKNAREKLNFRKKTNEEIQNKLTCFKVKKKYIISTFIYLENLCHSIIIYGNNQLL